MLSMETFLIGASDVYCYASSDLLRIYILIMPPFEEVGVYCFAHRSPSVNQYLATSAMSTHYLYRINFIFPVRKVVKMCKKYCKLIISNRHHNMSVQIMCLCLENT